MTVDDINKADGDNERKAERARVEYSNALHLFPASPDGWVPPVVTMSSLTGKGIHNSGRRFAMTVMSPRDYRSLKMGCGTEEPRRW